MDKMLLLYRLDAIDNLLYEHFNDGDKLFEFTINVIISWLHAIEAINLSHVSPQKIIHRFTQVYIYIILK